MQHQPTYNQLLEKGKEAVNGLKQLQRNPAWEKTADKPCEVFKMGIDNLMASKGVAVVNFNIQLIAAFLNRSGSLQMLDQTCIQEKIIFEEGDIQILYFRFKAPWPVSHRDFVLVSYKLQESPNKIYLGSKSCCYPFPEVKGVVRAEAFVGGYILQKIDENRTKVTYMSYADIKGSIPGMIKNELAKKQGEVAGRVEEAMKKNPIK